MDRQLLHRAVDGSRQGLQTLFLRRLRQLRIKTSFFLFSLGELFKVGMLILVFGLPPLFLERSERAFAGIPHESLSADIDRYWHCVAAQIEAGLIDDNNELIPHDPDTGLAAYCDWRARHPDTDIPPMRQPSGTAAS